MIRHEAVFDTGFQKMPDVPPIFMLQLDLVGERVHRSIGDRDLSFFKFMKYFGLVNVHGVFNRNLELELVQKPQ